MQTHCIYPHPQLDVVQLNAPDYNPDIDGQPDPVTDLQSWNAESITEDTTPNTTNSEQHAVPSTNSNRPQSQPSSALDDIDHPGHQDGIHSRAENPSNYHPRLEDIPELETDEENWGEGQFDDADLINHHNTTEESKRIHHEYSGYFDKVTEQEYSPYHGTASHLEYQILELEYYNSSTQQKQHQRHQNQQVYLPPPPLTEDLHTWYGHGCGRTKHLELHSHRLYVYLSLGPEAK